MPQAAQKAPTPQLIITLAPDGSLIAELPGANGGRRQVPITSLSTIRTILASQLSQSQSHTIGTNAAPTSGQVTHWEKHSIPDEHCPWCIADSLGIDTSRRAYKLAHRVGDGSVKVRYLPTKSRKISPKEVSLDALFDDDDPSLEEKAS
jgi:hypothetical protein